MADTTHARLVRRKKVRPYRGRGEVYAWLRAHHSQVLGLVADGRPWADLLAEMASEGVSGQRGVILTTKAVTKVWQRVCRDISAAEPIARPPKPPSRIVPTWRPSV